MSHKHIGAIAVLAIVVAGCSGPAQQAAAPVAPPTSVAAAPPAGAQPRLAADPRQLADDLVADEQALRDPSSSEQVLEAAARRQQVAYRALGRHPEWDTLTRPRIPRALLADYDRNVDARRQLSAMGRGKPTVPAWRITPPAQAGELLGYYRDTQAATGVGWNYLAAINFVETAFGRIAGVSTAGAQGPMQFLPSTFASYGQGGDIHAPSDSIAAAGRFLAAHDFSGNRDGALYRYNNSHQYVRAINDYAAVIADHPAAFEAYLRWDVYYLSTAGDVVLPEGYAAAAPIPVEEYLATNPQ